MTNIFCTKIILLAILLVSSSFSINNVSAQSSDFYMFIGSEVAPSGGTCESTASPAMTELDLYPTDFRGGLPANYESHSVSTMTQMSPLISVNGINVDLSLKEYDATLLSDPNYDGQLTTSQGGFEGGMGDCSMQAGSPVPQAVFDAGGNYYNERSGGTRNGLRNGLEFSFSEPVDAFSAFFGDLETRSDGQGAVALVVTRHTSGMVNIQEILPNLPTTEQVLCGEGADASDYDALCGEGTTRFIGFRSLGDPVLSMVVIVGDDDSCLNTSSCDGDSEHISMTLPTLFMPSQTVPSSSSSSSSISSSSSSSENSENSESSSSVSSSLDSKEQPVSPIISTVRTGGRD